jgi:hypothetical protein
MRPHTTITMHRLQMSQSIAYGEQSLALARTLQLPERMAFSLTDLALCYGTDGQMDKAKRALYEADALWQKLNNLPMRANNLSRLAHSCAWWGEYAISADDESYNRLQGEERRAWLDLLYAVSAEPSIVGASRHLLYIGQNR